MQTDQLQPPAQSEITLKQATLMFRQFVKERDWQKYHTPRNLVMAMMGQMGQIAEIFQWKGEVEPGLVGFSEKQKTHVGEQIVDVLSYLLRLADVSGIDIQQAVVNKLEKNRKKYPQEEVKSNRNLLVQIKEQRRAKREQQQNEEPVANNQN